MLAGRQPLRPRAPRYVWVLAGRHIPSNAAETLRPRAEFEVFMQNYDADLLCLSALDGKLPPITVLLKRLGLRRCCLAQLVQSRVDEFDAIIASGEDIGIPLAMASLFSLSSRPIHMIFHGHYLESRKLRLLAPLLRRMKHVHFHCLSQTLKERMQSILGIPDSRCHATGYGVDTDYFSDHGAGDGSVIASAGAANRDYETLAAAVRDLPVSVKIAADSAWVPPAAGLKAGAWPANVEVRSYGNYANLRALYGRSRFVVVPLHPATHACGYAVIAEAMAMGKAVIATRTSAPPDFLCDGATGLFADIHDVAGLRSKIRELLDQPEQAQAIGRRARAWIVEHNSLEGFCERLESIIRHASQLATHSDDAALPLLYPSNVTSRALPPREKAINSGHPPNFLVRAQPSAQPRV